MKSLSTVEFPSEVLKSVPDQRLRAAEAGWLDRLAMKIAMESLSRVATGSLSLALPSGELLSFGPAESPSARMQVRRQRFFHRVLLDGDIGLGEAYTDGDWDCEDLSALLGILIANQGPMEERFKRWAWLGRKANRLRHLLRNNTLSGSRANIRDHYDLGNQFFACFLDPSMTYSCALFSNPEQSLEEAQKNKIQHILSKARIGPEHHVLEIGSGWGAFALEAARNTGCRVTTITLSKEQLEVVQERVRRAGLQDRVQVQLCDYREVRGRYDRIVSIEMLEAVGHKYLGVFFNSIDQHLKPGGRAVLQVITIPDQRYEAYRKGCDWIQKHIFPGALLPSLTALCKAMTSSSRLIVESVENIGLQYARTLREWRERFKASSGALERLGFDRRFQRKWIYYFSYCEAGFATRTLGDLQMVLSRPGED